MARTIWENYLETRANASRWSGVYWGFTFVAATLSWACALTLVQLVISSIFMRKARRLLGSEMPSATVS